jgi:hypothetical protein
LVELLVYFTINFLTGGERVASFWHRPGVNLDYMKEFLRLVALCLSVPFDSVENERRFSAMNLTMTRLRNKLQEDHLNTCLRIAATSCTVSNFSFWEAFTIWDQERQRRGKTM